MKQIKIINGTYGYRPAPAVVEPKSAEDPAFFVEDGEAARLVALGVAKYIGTAETEPDAAPEAPENPAPEAPEAPAEESKPETPAAHLDAGELEKWDYNALKALAADMGVKPAGQKKTDYIAALVAADVEIEDDGDEMPELTAADPE